MPVFILLSRLSPEGLRTLKRNPSRVQLVNAEIEKLGARVVSQWATLGPYDFVTVIEAPDVDTVAQLSVEVGARGSTTFVALPAIPVDAFLERLSEADDD
jgi:uncharacterized protein with GYD domain